MLHSIGPRLRRATPTLGLVVMGFAAVVACSSGAGTASRPDGFGGGPAVTAAPFAAPTAAPTAASGFVNDAGGSSADGRNDGVTIDASGQDSLIIRTGSLTLEVRDIDGTLLQARGKIVGLGGYVSDSERSSKGDASTALITYRIPAARWDDAMDGLRGLATRVVSEQTKALEVTGQVLDLGARIDNLRATERALQAIMARATKISDVLEVQNQLTSVQGEIEQLSTQKVHLTDQAALGTLAVTYMLPIVEVAHVTSGWSLSVEFDRALAQLVLVAQGLAVAAVWLVVVVLPVGLATVVVIALAIFAARRLGLGRPNRGLGAGPAVSGSTSGR
jgi:hypothetical protein